MTNNNKKEKGSYSATFLEKKGRTCPFDAIEAVRS